MVLNNTNDVRTHTPVTDTTSDKAAGVSNIRYPNSLFSVFSSTDLLYFYKDSGNSHTQMLSNGSVPSLKEV